MDLRGTSDHAIPASIDLLEMVVATGNQLNTLMMVIVHDGGVIEELE